MLWTAPPSARKCQRCGCCLRLPRFGGAQHASDYDDRFRHRQVSLSGASCEPHKQAEHMAAPTKPAGVKKVLANPEPSTHGTFEPWADGRSATAFAILSIGDRGVVAGAGAIALEAARATAVKSNSLRPERPPRAAQARSSSRGNDGLPRDFCSAGPIPNLRPRPLG